MSYNKKNNPNGAEVLRTFSRSCCCCVRYGTVRCGTLRCVTYFSKLSLRCVAIRYGRLRCVTLLYVALPVAGNWASYIGWAKNCTINFVRRDLSKTLAKNRLNWVVLR